MVRSAEGIRTHTGQHFWKWVNSWAGRDVPVTNETSYLRQWFFDIKFPRVPQAQIEGCGFDKFSKSTPKNWKIIQKKDTCQPPMSSSLQLGYLSQKFQNEFTFSILVLKLNRYIVGTIRKQKLVEISGTTYVKIHWSIH